MYSEISAALAAPPQRRRRIPLACTHCRTRKIKCDQKRPVCSQCEKSKDIVCLYNADLEDPRRPQSVSQAHKIVKNKGQHFNTFAASPVSEIPTPVSSTFTNPSTRSSVHSGPSPSGPSSSSEPSTSAESRVELFQDSAAFELRIFNQRGSGKGNASRQFEVTPCPLPDSKRLPQCVVKLRGESYWVNQVVQVR